MRPPGHRPEVVDELAKRTLLHEHREVHVGFGAGKVVGGDRDGIAGRRLRGGLCECGGGRREQQARADLNAKIFMASLSLLTEQ